MTSIYRFETLNYFEQVVRDKELTFVSPYEWPDINEGLLFKNVFLRGDMEKVRAAADQMFGNTFADKHIDGTAITDLLIVLRTTRLAQCWSKCEGNSILWRNKDVRIEVRREDISHLSGVEVRDVEYVESVTIEDGLRRLKAEPVAGGNRIDIDSVLLVKHCSFSEEQEVRLLATEGENVNRDRPERIPFTRVFKQLHRQGKISKEDYEGKISHLRIIDKKKVSFAHIENFIKSVMLNSSASTDVENKVERLCEKYSLQYLGRWQPRAS